MSDSQHLAGKIGALFANLAEVETVALGGSLTTGATDSASDMDVYVYTRSDIPLATRMAIVDQSGGASRANLGLNYWGPGDEWFDAASGFEVDVVYFDTGWMQSQIQRVVKEHQPGLGYSTCFWHTVRHSRLLYDRHQWFEALQGICAAPYPESLRRNIIAFNHPVLRSVIPSYYNQVEKAIKREDAVSVNHRLAALLASYFDLIFAANRVLHPGEKRLLEYAHKNCEKLPVEMAVDLKTVLDLAACSDPALLPHLGRLLDRMDDFLLETANYSGGRFQAG